MPRPRYRSRKLRRVQKKMPGGRTKQTYVKRKPKLPKCAECRVELKGIPRLRDNKAKNIAKTKKRPSRPYGGFLCNKCARVKLKKEARLS
ncbi:50S ribosomal protein L34e [Candidatus Woesearchaeota archaeon]|nr:50S ribosomal protein L34e [Candidatus Woesearchaeota archaeon]